LALWKAFSKLKQLLKYAEIYFNGFKIPS